MDDPLLHYYERELTFMRESGAEFAKKYPKIASRLLLDPDRCEDPHTERLLEAFSFLTGRIQKKIDDSYPELTESLLQIIYPHYTRPMPSMTVVKFMPRLQNVPPSGYRVKKGTQLFSQLIKGTRLTFRTTQEIQLLPVEVANAETTFPPNPGVGALNGIKIELNTAPKMKIEQVQWPDALRFYLNGQQQQVFKLYELLMNHTVQVEIISYTEHKAVRRRKDTLKLSARHVKPMGFSKDEAILPWPEQSFDGYRLLFEYFAFPEKFLFFELTGMKKLGQIDGDLLEINIYLNHKDTERLLISQDTFCMYASPAINLFKQIAMPVRVEHKKAEYPIYHDIYNKDTTEVFSVDKVTGISENGDSATHYQPFYALSHFEDQEVSEAYWHARRRKSSRKGDQGMDLLLSFTDDSMAAAEPRCSTLTVHTTCTNRDLPSRMIPGGYARDFFIEVESPIEGVGCMMKPTQARRPKPGSRMQWRLISHLSLNYLSLVAKNGQGLKELLKLYDIHDSPVTRQQIEGLEEVYHRHVAMRIGRSFCKGVEVLLVMNEDKFVGSSVYLFASVLERFLAHYVSINSFTRLVVKSIQRRQEIKAWPPRNGERILL
jgi:type VI secretion system protein ImpG